MLDVSQTERSDISLHIGQHLWLVSISIGIAIFIGLPLGILITRRKRLRGPVLGIANVMQTIPVWLVSASDSAAFIGGIGPARPSSHSSFMRWLPIIRNTVTGIWGRRRIGARSGRGHGHDRPAGTLPGRTAAGDDCDPDRREGRGSDHFGVAIIAAEVTPVFRRVHLSRAAHG